MQGARKGISQEVELQAICGGIPDLDFICCKLLPVLATVCSDSAVGLPGSLASDLLLLHLHMQPSIDWWAQRRLPVRLYLLSPSPLLEGQPDLPPAERVHRERLLAAHWDLWPSYDALIEELAP